jgi:hypothetical protein
MKKKIKKLLHYSILCIGMLLFLDFYSQKVEAAIMLNNEYTLDKQTIEILPAIPTKAIPNHTPQQAPFSSKEIEGSIAVKLNEPLIDFGILSATNPIIRKINISVMSSNNSYQVAINQNHPLQNRNNTLIPDTTCDNGSCTQSLPSLWESTLTYGFGYRCEGKICNNNFKQKNYYQQIADTAKKEPMQIIFQGIQNQQTDLLYKINIPRIQQSGIYSNMITYIITSNY